MNGTSPMATQSTTLSLRRFGALFLLGSSGVIALFATADHSLFDDAAAESGLAIEILLGIAAVQSLVLLGVAVLIGLYFAPNAGLRSHLLNRVTDGCAMVPEIRTELPAAVTVGTLVGGMLLIAERVAPTPIGGQATVTVGELLESLPMRVLYGGITEELLLRWGVMSLLVGLLWRGLGRNADQPSRTIVWTAIVAAAILFGIGHLPAAATVYGTITLDVLAFILVGNGIGGIAFGWLYWRHSLEAAMIAHGFGHVVAVGGHVLLVSV